MKESGFTILFIENNMLKQLKNEYYFISNFISQKVRLIMILTFLKFNINFYFIKITHLNFSPWASNFFFFLFSFPLHKGHDILVLIKWNNPAAREVVIIMINHQLGTIYNNILG